MGFKVNTNIDALNAYYALMKVNNSTIKSQIKLATGKQINHVWDDTSGFTIGKQLETKAKILKSVQGNISSGKDMLSTAESALLNIKDLITKIKTKISDGTNPTADRQALARDIAALGEEITSIMKTTKFNESTLLVGTLAASDTNYARFSFQVTDKTEDKMILDFASTIASSAASTVTYSDGATTDSLFLELDIANILSSIMATGSNSYVQDVEFATAIASLGNITSSGGLKDSVGTTVSQVDYLQEQIDYALQKIGYFAQRFDIKNEFLDVAISNAESSVSRIFDTDYAFEQLNATKNNIMQQAALSMMSQLSINPQSVLQLFQ